MTEAPRGWLLLLSAWLFVWEPMRLAAELAGSMSTLGMRGVAGGVELVVHGAVAAMAMAAARALWVGNPVGPRLASIAVAASAAVTIQSVVWSRLPVDAPPGQGLPLSILAIAHAAGWITYLRRSRRVRAAFE